MVAEVDMGIGEVGVRLPVTLRTSVEIAVPVEPATSLELVVEETAVYNGSSVGASDPSSPSVPVELGAEPALVGVPSETMDAAVWVFVAVATVVEVILVPVPPEGPPTPELGAAPVVAIVAVVAITSGPTVLASCQTSRTSK